MLLILFVILSMKTYSDTLHSLVYNTDASHIKQQFSIDVALPSNKEELLVLLQKAVNANQHVLLRGGGTNLVGNVLPQENSLVIDCSRMNSILKINDESVVVEPWVVLDELNDTLKQYWKYFPVILGSHASAEIGWMIATNGAGMRAVKYWKMENWVKRLEVLYVDRGKKIQSTMLSGDQMFDFFWSEGGLWVVVEAELWILPLVWKKTATVRYCDDLKDAMNFVNSIMEEKNDTLSALEILNPIVATMLWERNQYLVFVEYEDEFSWEIKDEALIAQHWKKRDACYSVIVNAWYNQIEDPKIPQEHRLEFFEWFENHHLPIFWHIGIGVLHPHFKEDQMGLIDEMYDFVQKLWWNVSWEHGIGLKKRKFLSNSELKKNEDLKEKRDPMHIFWC